MSFSSNFSWSLILIFSIVLFRLNSIKRVLIFFKFSISESLKSNKISICFDGGNKLSLNLVK